MDLIYRENMSRKLTTIMHMDLVSTQKSTWNYEVLRPTSVSGLRSGG